MKKIVITGASGFLGGHLMALAQETAEAHGTFYQHPPPELTPNWQQINLGQFLDVHTYIQELRPDVIIHAAAISDIDYCQTKPDEAELANVIATRNIARAATMVNARFIYVSTDTVFDGKWNFYREEDTARPINMYGETKAHGEFMVREYCENYTIARVALLYGRPKMYGTSFSEWIEEKLKNGESIELYNNQYRTPILVNNCTECLLELATKDFVGILHLAGDTHIDRYAFGELLCDMGGYDRSLLKSIDVKQVTFLAPRPKDVSLCVSRTKRVLDTPLYSVEEGLQTLFTA